MQPCTIPYHKRKPLRGRQRHQGLGLHLERRSITPALMQEGPPEMGGGETIGMVHSQGQGQSLLTPPHGLRWKAETPQREG